MERCVNFITLLRNPVIPMAGLTAGGPLADGAVVDGLDVDAAAAIDEMDVFQIVAHRAFRFAPADLMLAFHQRQVRHGVEEIAVIFSPFGQITAAAGQRHTDKKENPA